LLQKASKQQEAVDTQNGVIEAGHSYFHAECTRSHKRESFSFIADRFLQEFEYSIDILVDEIINHASSRNVEKVA